MGSCSSLCRSRLLAALQDTTETAVNLPTFNCFVPVILVVLCFKKAALISAKTGAVCPEPARPVRHVLFPRQPVACWVGAVCVCARAASVLSEQKNPLNVSSWQSKRQGEPAWPAEFRWVLLVLHHPRCSVCHYQLNLVCVPEFFCLFFLHTFAHCGGWKCKCQVFSLNKAAETIIYWPRAALSALCGL